MALFFEDDNSLIDFIEGHGVKGLADSGISEVPTKFIHPISERATELPVAMSKIPAPIDLSKLDGPEHDKVVEAITKAAETLGFFQVVNHGVPPAVLDSVIESAHRFFNQPPETKAVYLQDVSPSPLVYYTSSFAPRTEAIMNWRDVLTMGYTNDAEVLQHWPDSCKKDGLEFLKSSNEVVRRIFEVLIGNLKLSIDSTKLESLIGTKRLIMNFYPPCPNPELTMGGRKHTDIGVLTLLLQDGIGGLQVKVKEEWIEVPPISGALVINLGDTFQVLSNDHYKSSEHRVKVSHKSSRVSVPIFSSPLLTENIGPFPELVERDGVARYRNIICEEHKKNCFTKIGEGKNTLDFMKMDYIA